MRRYGVGMRALRTIAIGLTLAAACARDRESPSKNPPIATPAEAAVHDAPAKLADAPSAGAAPIAFQPLPLDAPLPEGARTGTALVGGARWVDRGGRNTLYLIERASADRARVALYAVLEQGEGVDRLRLRELKDQASCAAPSPTAFEPALEVTDLDGDGDGEVWLGYLVGCGDDDVPVRARQFVLEGKSKLEVRGDGPLDGKPDPDAAAWQPAWLERATAAYERLAARIPAHPAAAEALDGDDFATIEVDPPGGAPIRVSYPDLAPLPAAIARELTARMRAFLLAGAHDGACEVTLAVPELISIGCRAGDHARAPIVVWRAPGLPPVKLDQLVEPARLEPLCGTATPDGAWVLRIDGVAWLPGDPAPPAGCAQGIRWVDMVPTDARTRDLVARMLTRSDP